MAKVLLVSSNTTLEPSAVYPLGMAVVAAGLSAQGHRVRQFDFLAEGESMAKLREAIREYAPGIVGVSIRNIDNVDSTLAGSNWYLSGIREMVAVIREETKVAVVLGGPGYSILPGPILAYVKGDYGVAGEGEAAFGELIEKIEKGGEIPRIIRSRDNPLPGSRMGMPQYDEKLVSFYMERSGMMNLQSKRGCPHTCSYCTYPALEGRKLRVREPSVVVDDMERMKATLGVESFFFTDSVFNDAAGNHMALVEEILRRDIKIRWTAFFRPAGMEREALAMMKRSGLYAVEVGTDAASDATLAGISKGFSFSDVMAFNDLCLAEKMPAAHFIIFGGPGETGKTLAEGIDNVARLGKSVVFAFSGIRVLPGTPLHSQAMDEGCVGTEDPLLMPAYYISPGVEYAAMNETLTEAFRRKRNRIFPPSLGVARMSAMNLFGYRGLLWDRLVDFSK